MSKWLIGCAQTIGVLTCLILIILGGYSLGTMIREHAMREKPEPARQGTLRTLGIKKEPVLLMTADGERLWCELTCRASEGKEYK